MKEYYLDCAATTKVNPKLYNYMTDFSCAFYANPSSIHSAGLYTNSIIQDVKHVIARYLGNTDDNWYENADVIFTSGATEANNLVTLGTYYKDTELIYLINDTEHQSLYNVFEHGLKGNTFSAKNITFDQFDKKLAECEDALRALYGNKDVYGIVCIMAVNNITGYSYIDSLPRFKQICHKHNFLLHVDATQALCKYDLNIDMFDSMSASMHKVNGIKGIGFLYVTKQMKGIVRNIVSGGHQNDGLRAGTYPLELIYSIKPILASYRRVCTNLDTLYAKLIRALEFNKIRILYSSSTPYILNIGLENINGEKLVLALSRRGIYCSTGSACSYDQENYVIKNSVDPEHYNNYVRLSCDYELSDLDIDEIVDAFIEAVKEVAQLDKLGV